MKDEQLYSYFNDTADPEEIREIESWLQENPEHQKDYDNAHMVYNAMLINEAGYRRSRKAVAGDRKSAKIRDVLKIVSGIAAGLVLLAGTWFSGKYIGEEMYSAALSRRMTSVSVPAGQSMSIVLDDGTRVFLNGGARIEYPVLFARDFRKVRLSGEAFLDVSHDERHPFIVETFDSMIEVLGTEFNVYADEENGHFSTTLLDGKVKVSTLGGEHCEQVILSPDERATKVGNHLVVTKVPAVDVVSWIDGYINIGGVGFEELMHRFEYTYNVRIVLERTDIEGYMSGKIRVSEGIDFALHLLQKSCSFTYERDSSGAIIIR